MPPHISQTGKPMTTRKLHILVWFIAPLVAFSAGACSSGGGGSNSSANSAGNSSPSSTVPIPTTTTTGPNNGTDTGVPGSVGAPGPAIYSSAVPAQVAGGSSFASLTNVSFPIISSSLKSTSTGLSGVSGAGGTATVTTSSTTTDMQLIIPAVSVNTSIKLNQNVALGIDSPTWGLSYVVMGEWGERAQSNGTGPLQNISTFVFGFETPSTALPSSGTAAFSGSTWAFVYKPSATNIQSQFVEGTAALNVNFGSGNVTGTLSQMRYFTAPGYETWNDVSINANLTGGTNRFSGTTAASTAPGTAYSLSATATGRVDGAFYGPAAQNAGAVWSLGDGTRSAVGSFIAGTTP